MANQNGQLVLQTLENLEEPSTVANISKLIAKSLGAKVNEVKDIVKETLDGGVQYGYVQHSNRKYFAAPLDLEEIRDELATSEEDGESVVQEAATKRNKQTRRARSDGRHAGRRSRSRRRSPKSNPRSSSRRGQRRSSS